MNKREILQRLGLTKNEIEVYLFLINSGPNRITDISRHTKIHRPLVYQAITPLLEKKLINYQTKGKQKYYTAESPSQLRKIADNFQKNINELVPDLEQTYQKRTSKPTIRFLEGPSGIAAAHMDLANSMRRNETYYRYSIGSDYQTVNQYIPDEYRRIRNQKNLQRFVINNQPMHRTAHQKPDINRLFRIIPPEDDNFSNNINFVIYKDRVTYLDYSTENAFIIENKNIANFHENLFKLLWKKIK